MAYFDIVILASYFFTDGVKLFNQGIFSVWSLLLINLNIPPSERFKEKHLILLGVIPGPNSSKDMNSFLHLMINKFKVLEEGIDCWNAYTQTTQSQ